VRKNKQRIEGGLVMSIRLPATPASASVVRHQLAADLSERTIPPTVVDDVILVATELVSNAIRHAEPLADGQVTVTWKIEPDGVFVRVTDGGGANTPRVRHVSPRDTSGRGLALVEALAARWGVEDTGDATTVWALVKVSD
jgi:serine/threonine-protein kinase RsbW